MKKPYSVKLIRPRRDDYPEHKEHGWQAALPDVFAQELEKTLNQMAEEGYRCQVHVIPVTSSNVMTYVVGEILPKNMKPVNSSDIKPE